jgi:hypothetical protein
MKATLIAKAKEVNDDGSIVEVVIWELPEPIPPSTHKYKYRLFYGQNGKCRIRFDTLMSKDTEILRTE